MLSVISDKSLIYLEKIFCNFANYAKITQFLWLLRDSTPAW